MDLATEFAGFTGLESFYCVDFEAEFGGAETSPK